MTRQTETEYPIAASVPLNTHALRPMRIGKDERAVHYTGTTFPSAPFRGCELTIRRMECFGMVSAPGTGPLVGSTFVDLLDADGDILDTLPVTKRGFEYMRRKLRFVRER